LLIALVRSTWPAPAKPELDPRLRGTANLAVAVLAANLLFGAFLLQRQPTITASLSYPLQTYYTSTVAQLGVTITNTTGKTLRPRFSVQHDGTQPLPWEIRDGPELIKPGQSGSYVIRTLSLSRAFSAARGAQLVITDGSNDPHLRAVINIPGDVTFNSPDLIINPSFTFWASNQQTPAGWSWQPTEPKSAPPRVETIEGRTALALSALQGSSRLSQTVTLPGPISIWVRPTVAAPDPLRSAYGLEFEDGPRRLQVLFGDRDGIDETNRVIAVVYVRAPLNQWSRQTVDLRELYARLGWDLPPYSIRDSQGIEFAARQVRISLIVSGMQVSQSFGAIEQDPSFASPQTLVAEAIAHPDDYYVNLGNEYCRQRNIDLAAEAYQRALEYKPDNADAQQGLDTCR
jgi:hypothetical protein